MVLSDIEHISRQVLMTAGLAKGIDFLRRADVRSMQEGKIGIDGSRVFALIQRYETKMTDELKFEHHRKYIDIQYLVSGEEVVGWVPAEQMVITEAYDEDRDVCFGMVSKEDMTLLHLKAGQLAVLYPEDGHAPGLAARVTSPVMKIVVKVAVDHETEDSIS
jgi:biofilm protein TabA